MVLSLTLAASGCGPPAADQVVRDFLEAWRTGDDAKAAGLTVEGDISAFRDGDTFIHPTRPSFTVGQADIRGEVAYVSFTLELEGGSREGTAVLRRQGRIWKVSLTGTMTAWAASEPPP